MKRMRKKRQGKKRATKKSKLRPIADELEHDNIPRSFVIHHGVISSNIKHLLYDFKGIMKPNTAEKLKARKRNKIKDFIAMSGPMKVTHLIIFSQTDNGLILKIGRFPQGPTLYFRIENYTLLKDVVKSQKKSVVNEKLYRYSPCLMTNLQPSEGEQHMQLCSKLFLDMFPSIEPLKIRAHHIRRCCLIHYDETSQCLDLRHYAIKTRPMGISKATCKMIGNKVPNLGSFVEVSDFIVNNLRRSELLSDSEAEDLPTASVNIEKKRKDQVMKQPSLVKLYDIGPRLTLKLLKIEAGLCQGAVLYHSYIVKTAEEKLQDEQKKKNRERLLRFRKKKQEENVRRKEKEKEDHKRKCLKGMGFQDDAEDDLDYYRQEVGEEPDEDLFQKSQKKRKRLKEPEDETTNARQETKENPNRKRMKKS